MTLHVVAASLFELVRDAGRSSRWLQIRPQVHDAARFQLRDPRLV